MTFSKTLLASFAIGTMALASLGTLANAEPHEGGKGHKARGAEHFAKMDTDGDGKISLEEHQAASQDRFSKLDADGDGFVTHEEMKAKKEAMREKRKAHKEKMSDKPVE